MNIIDVFDSIIQNTAISKIAIEDHDIDLNEEIINELKLEHKMLVLSLINFVEKNAVLLRAELLNGKEPPKLWTNVFIK